jgi:hypothetical protein
VNAGHLPCATRGLVMLRLRASGPNVRFYLTLCAADPGWAGGEAPGAPEIA